MMERPADFPITRNVVLRRRATDPHSVARFSLSPPPLDCHCTPVRHHTRHVEVPFAPGRSLVEGLSQISLGLGKIGFETQRLAKLFDGLPRSVES